MRLVRPLAALLVALPAAPAGAQVARQKDWTEAVQAAAGASARTAAKASAAGGSSQAASLPDAAPGGAAPAPAGGALGGAGGGNGGPTIPPMNLNSEQRQALDKLTAENQLVREEVAKRLKALIEEKEELRIKSDLEMERLRAELARLDADYQKLLYENRLLEEKAKRELAEMAAQQRRLAAENALGEERHRKELQDLRQDKEKLALGNDRLRETLRGEELKNQSEKMSLDLESQRMSVEETRLKVARDKAEDAVARLRIGLEERAKKDEWRREANKDPVVLAQPYQDGVLTVSDRRVSLNGVIMKGVSDYVADRIDYFNNVSEDPIFVVIDRCPGGSVMEGYRIVKAIQSSKAPVHVVVKSFAASMCAVITTLAPHSYVYPNAVILHHQMSTMLWGNMTQTKEQLEIAKEWFRRLAEPVAKKMGTSLDGLVKEMYEKNSDGDWEEFGDRAVSYKWADAVVKEVRETGVIKKPDDEKRPNPGLVAWASAEKLDEKGAPYVTLPRLDPFDFYWLYNPDHYYR